MAVNKKFTFTVDVTHSLTNEQFQVVEGDTGNQLDIKIIDDGVPVDLTATRVVMVFSKGASLSMQDTTIGGGVTVDDVDPSLLHVDLYNGSFSPGLVECTIQIYSGDELDTLITTGSFNFRCARSLLSDNTIQSMNEYNVLQSLISEVQGLTSGIQADWSENDSLSRHYIKNKPNEFNPSAHASRHHSDGTDPLTYSDIGAMPDTATYADVGAAPATHASQHKTGGSDPITPANIGAIATSAKGAASGVASLDGNQKLTASQASSRIISKSAAFSIAKADDGCLYKMTNSSAVTITIPASGFSGGEEFEFVKYGAGNLTFAGATGVNIRSANGYKKITDQYGAACLKCLDSSNWLLAGDLSS